MRLVNAEKLSHLQTKTDHIRNICIIAHVDHGKTTLADSLVASNGIISPKMVGKLRYMDSRKDEQERGITMKSSSIALLYTIGKEEFLVNLIDSPGHVDFSLEVSTAVRLCDGAIVVVDVVEGVCPQTRVALRQAWLENIVPVLVLNKIDRLILEMKLSPLDAYVHLTQVLEQVNAVVAQLFTTEILGKSASDSSSVTIGGLYDWTTGLEDIDDSNIYFSPEKGNVVFASAIDGWGFSLHDFASLYAKKLEISEDELLNCLWGDYYLHGKTRKLMPGAQEKAKKPIFVQFVLENIWSLYDTIIVRKDKERLQKICESLNVKLTTRDLRHTDGKVQLQAVCSQWLPLSSAILDMVCTKLPSPSHLSQEKAEKLMCSHTQRFDTLPVPTQVLRSAFMDCNSSKEAPLIVFVSKMFPVERKNLPENQARPLTAEEIAQRREQARHRHAQKSLAEVDSEGMRLLSDTEAQQTKNKEGTEDIKVEDTKPGGQESEDVFMAFARVYSGTLKVGEDVFVLGPKHNPQAALEKEENKEEVDPSLTLKDLKPGQHLTRARIGQLYILMGRELMPVTEAPAGNVIGISGLEEHILKSATLSSTVACPAFTELLVSAAPILRVAVEPAHPQDMPALVNGLKLLNQADACVQVFVQETGEHVLATAGEVHLDRCITDLRERYAKVEISVSEPIVPFRETVVEPPTVDMVNEAIIEQSSASRKEVGANEDGSVVITTANKQCTVKIKAAPLPTEVTQLLEENSELLRAMDHSLAAGTLSGRTIEAIKLLRKRLEDAWNKKSIDSVWSLGPRRCGPNVLLNCVAGYNHTSIWDPTPPSEVISSESYSRSEHESSFVNGFQMATLAGPLCEEPMMGVCFEILEWSIKASPVSSDVTQPFGPFSGQLMSAVKEGCRKAFQAQPQRLMAAMYKCSIQANAEVLGRMYAVLGRRQGRVLHGDMTEGSASFTIEAVLPVVESFNFAAEIRKQTSGLASPQLVFSHWEVIDIDPFWRPNTEEELLHFGEKADSGNRARQYMDAVRRRKGLPVERKIVEFAEKQRTLSKNK
ncbi:elongation factor-like GTPase 1 [Schistocerca piceifrons]|uniref:elongation factor-like GTPase 1 n=1 Tax=Schistocerca piceifrons TaxID=274613 RepID=UPI001F5F64FE|nr:elongation factor-like GTPase 1 [Schistocerca piceifrons]